MPSIFTLISRRLRPVWLTLVLGAMLLAVSCQSQPATVAPADTAADAPALPPSLSTLSRQEPPVRIRIVANAPHVTLDGHLVIQADRGSPVVVRGPVNVGRADRGYVVRPARGHTLKFPRTAGLWVASQDQGSVRVNGKAYPHRVRVEIATGRYARAGHLDVVNHLPMENYLPGVLQAELYPSWHEQAFAAQAIAARSYALFEMSLNPGRTFDLESTVASQAYAGAQAHARAVKAVRDTRGVVLSWQGRILPAFYSSACGGVNQYAGLVLPHGTDAGPVNTARDTCVWCKGSRYHRWGPISRDRATLSQRIAAWGRATDHAVAKLGLLEHITVSAATPAGRPTQFTLIDAQGRSFTMGAESFRFACNYTPPAPGPAAVPAQANLRSSHCRPAVVGDRVIFEGGRGFGHGVGLCQWGAQGLASSGYNAQSILAFYYPGSTLLKFY